MNTKKMRKAIISMEITCGCCGGLLMRDYHNASSVRKLKEMAKDWRFTDEYGNTCPECLENEFNN